MSTQLSVQNCVSFVFFLQIGCRWWNSLKLLSIRKQSEICSVYFSSDGSFRECIKTFCLGFPWDIRLDSKSLCWLSESLMACSKGLWAAAESSRRRGFAPQLPRNLLWSESDCWSKAACYCWWCLFLDHGQPAPHLHYFPSPGCQLQV